jgi:hypothetical protein
MKIKKSLLKKKSNHVSIDKNRKTPVEKDLQVFYSATKRAIFYRQF